MSGASPCDLQLRRPEQVLDSDGHAAHSCTHCTQHRHEDGDNHCEIPGTSIDVGRHHPPAAGGLQESVKDWQGGGLPAQCDCCPGCNVISAEDAGEKVVTIKPGDNMTKTF